MSGIMKKVQDLAKRNENINNMEKVISYEVRRKFDKSKIKVISAVDFFDNYAEDDVIESIQVHNLFNETDAEEEPYTIVDKEQLKFYEEYIKICNETNEKIENIINEYLNNYFNDILKYNKQALDEDENE